MKLLIKHGGNFRVRHRVSKYFVTLKVLLLVLMIISLMSKHGPHLRMFGCRCLSAVSDRIRMMMWPVWEDRFDSGSELKETRLHNFFDLVVQSWDGIFLQSFQWSWRKVMLQLDRPTRQKAAHVLYFDCKSTFWERVWCLCVKYEATVSSWLWKSTCWALKLVN